MSGELSAVAAVVSRIGMPVLAAFLADRGDLLLDVSVDSIVRAGGTRAIARALAETGEQVELLGAEETAEGLTRVVVAGGLAARSNELADDGAALAYEGFAEMELGESVREAAVEVGAAGLTEAGAGMQEINTAGAIADPADDIRN